MKPRNYLPKVFPFVITCALATAFFNLSSCAENLAAHDIFRKAGRYYEKGEYDEATKEYGKLSSRGLESGNLYYNIGNCYFKKGELGKAILNYKRASCLIPRDSDLKSNYDYAVYKSESRPLVVPKNWAIRTIEKAFESFTIDELTLLLSAFYVFAAVLLWIGIFAMPARKYIMFIVAISFIIFSLGAFGLWQKVSAVGSESVVIAKIADAKFGPFESATTFFQINEGDNVCIIDSKNGWRKIKRADGKIGWVKSSNLGMI